MPIVCRRSCAFKTNTLSNIQRIKRWTQDRIWINSWTCKQEQTSQRLTAHCRRESPRGQRLTGSLQDPQCIHMHLSDQTKPCENTKEKMWSEIHAINPAQKNTHKHTQVSEEKLRNCIWRKWCVTEAPHVQSDPMGTGSIHVKVAPSASWKAPEHWKGHINIS